MDYKSWEVRAQVYADERLSAADKVLALFMIEKADWTTGLGTAKWFRNWCRWVGDSINLRPTVTDDGEYLEAWEVVANTLHRMEELGYVTIYIDGGGPKRTVSYQVHRTDAS